MYAEMDLGGGGAAECKNYGENIILVSLFI